MRTEQRERTVVEKYNVYIAKDGKEFAFKDECENYEKMLDGIRKVCPACNGQKYIRGKWIEAYDNYDVGHVEGHFEYNRCEKCKGKGYLEKKVTWE